MSQGAVGLLSNPKDFGVFGVRLSQGTKMVGVEYTAAYAPNFVDSDARALILNANALLQAPLLAFKPYGTVGVGAIRSTGSGPVAFGNKVALNYGGGFKVFLLPFVGGRFDVRGYSIPEVQSKTLNVLEVSVGVVFSIRR